MRAQSLNSALNFEVLPLKVEVLTSETLLQIELSAKSSDEVATANVGILQLYLIKRKLKRSIALPGQIFYFLT